MRSPIWIFIYLLQATLGLGAPIHDELQATNDAPSYDIIPNSFYSTRFSIRDPHVPIEARVKQTLLREKRRAERFGRWVWSYIEPEVRLEKCVYIRFTSGIY
jgi:hypothetical protein